LSAVARFMNRRTHLAGQPLRSAAFLMVISAIAAGLLLYGGVQAQNRPQPPVPDQRGTIRVEVNLVNLLASVLDSNNRPVPDLKQEQFEIFEEGKPQKIELFETETQQPLDMVLMIDSSLSESAKLPFELQAAERFVRRVMRPVDRVAVYEFGDAVTQLAGFSNQPDRVRSALQRIQPDTGTALYDAVFLGAQALERGSSDRRRVLLLLTDAGETTSRADFESARRAAVRAEALLYGIVVRPVNNEGGRNTAGEHALETIADSSGGGLYFPAQIAQLDQMFDRIDQELRTQYRLAYYPNPRPPQGAYRQIEVRVKGDYTVRYRKAYYAGGVAN
jgi:Ca-activated chloride channel family protein